MSQAFPVAVFDKSSEATARLLMKSVYPVSVLIPTFNEEHNLGDCLTSVAWAPEVFVIDSYSTDGTELIASRHGAHFFQHRFENYAAQKNWALDNLPLSQDWVLILDADERVPRELAEEIACITQGDVAVTLAGYYINRRFIFMGRWIRHCGWYPSWNLRLFRRGKARYEERPVHEHMVVDGPVGYLKHDLIHEDHRGLQAWLAKHNQYSTLEAEARWTVRQRSGTGLRVDWFGSPVERKRAIKESIWPRLPARPLLWFVYMYLLRLGFLDGWQGFAFCVLQAMQEFHVGLKLRELQHSIFRATPSTSE